MMQPNYDDVKPFDVSRESFDQLVTYYNLLIKWQKAINLVSPKSLPEAWKRHFVDSVQLLQALPDENAMIADLGSGGGFAGLVVALCRPQLEVHLVDSDMRKCQFLKNVSREIGAANVTAHNSRVEQVLADLTPDVITARGFTALEGIFTAVDTAGSLSHDLKFSLLKGVNYLDEIEAAKVSFDFQWDDIESITDPQARILQIKNVNKLS